MLICAVADRLGLKIFTALHEEPQDARVEFAYAYPAGSTGPPAVVAGGDWAMGWLASRSLKYFM